MFYLLQAHLPHAAPPSPTLLCTESWMKEDVQEKIKPQQDQPAQCGFMRVNMERAYYEGFEQRMDNKSIVINIQGLSLE